MEIISIINQKGGVGKSTVASCLGRGMIEAGKKVLLIDMDAQCSMTSLFKISNPATNNLLNLFNKEASLKDCVTVSDAGEHLVMGSKLLSRADQVFTTLGSDHILHEAIKDAIDTSSINYDYVIIDTPPGLGILSLNALTASNSLIIVSQADVLSIQGIEQLFDTFTAVRKYNNSSLKIRGIVVTRYNKQANLSKEVINSLQITADASGFLLYETKIRECIAIKESQAMKESIFTYAKRSNAALDFRNLTKEVLQQEV